MSVSVTGGREQLITALSYPRLLMEREIKQRTCSQQHQFNDQAEDCNECLYILECQGYSQRLTESYLSKATERELYKLLQFGLEYVDQQQPDENHQLGACDCDQCGWRRMVTPLLGAFVSA